MNTLNKLTPITLWEQLYKVIKNDIEAGKYKPGDKIPTEFELKDIYQSIQKDAIKPQFLRFPLPPTYDKLPCQLKSLEVLF